MVKYCPRCGTQNPDDARFCMKCGFDFSQLSQPNYQPTQPNYQPTSPTQPSSQSDQLNLNFNISKLTNLSNKYFILVGGVLTGTSFVLFALSLLMLFASPFTQSGGAGSYAPFDGLMVAAFALYLVYGIFALILGIMRRLSGAMSFILGILTFLYFMLLGVGMFVLQGVSSGVYKTDTDGVELILGAIFILVTMFTLRSDILTNKIVGYTFLLVGIILAYAGITGGLVRESLFLSSLAGVMFSASFFVSNLAIVAGILLPLVLITNLFISKTIVGNSITNMLLSITLLIFGIGQILLGASAIGAGLPSTSGLPGILVGSFYTGYVAGIIDLIAGIFLLIVSIFFIVDQSLSLSKIASSQTTSTRH